MSRRTLNTWPREFSPAARALIEARSQGICEACGVAPAMQVHHRLYKSRLGIGNPANGLHVCGIGGTDGCHALAHSGYFGESLGWAIRSGHDPEEVPVFRRSDRTWWRFDNDGGTQHVHPIDAMEFLTLIGAIREGMAR